ncbi:hypothetical protein U9M48_027906 [Paspalum notatum var. saurae]|uniref:Polyprotein n=1 Tax=Paspalum notatum var. saurae TaxID=547442 RepID=A0AAQ3TVR0_PASNO
MHIVHEPNGKVLTVLPTLVEQVKKDQASDEETQKIAKHIKKDGTTAFRISEDGLIRYKDRLVVPKEGKAREIIMGEAHESTYSIHPGANKMYQDLSQKFWWRGMKADVANHVAQCDVCQQVKADHQKPAGLLQPLLKWDEAEDKEQVPTKPTLLKEAEEKIEEIRERLKIAQTRQKNYTDRRRRELSFEEGDLVYLKVSPIRGTRRFQVKGKLAHRYIGPNKIEEGIGKVAYRLQLRESMSDIHNVFHVSQLKKCLKEPARQVELDTLDLQPDLRCKEVHIKILDTGVKKTRRSAIKICRVLWSRHGKEESTWEREDALREEHPHLFEA